VVPCGEKCLYGESMTKQSCFGDTGQLLPGGFKRRTFFGVSCHPDQWWLPMTLLSAHPD
jgi:hypothetical protein